MKKIVVASNNKGKIKEIKEIFKEFDVISLKEVEEKLNKKIELIEDKETFKENAIEKVKCLVNQIDVDELCLADDSGLSIDALDGFPGVYTARWMDADDHTKNLELIKKLDGISNRNAKYTTAIAIADKKMINVIESHLEGEITKEPRGNNGFGFDEILQIENGKTLAELSMEEKNEISSRKKALEEIKNFIM